MDRRVGTATASHEVKEYIFHRITSNTAVISYIEYDTDVHDHVIVTSTALSEILGNLWRLTSPEGWRWGGSVQGMEGCQSAGGSG